MHKFVRWILPSPGPGKFNKMSDLFKIAFWYIIRRVCKTVISPYMLQDVPDQYKTQVICTKAVSIYPYLLGCVPNHLKTKEICNEAVRREPYVLDHVSDHFKMQDMCNKAIEEDSFSPEACA